MYSPMFVIIQGTIDVAFPSPAVPPPTPQGYASPPKSASPKSRGGDAEERPPVGMFTKGDYVGEGCPLLGEPFP